MTCPTRRNAVRFVLAAVLTVACVSLGAAPVVALVLGCAVAAVVM